MKKLLESLFIIFLLLFIVSGALLVIGQIVGVLAQNGEIILSSHNLLANIAFVSSAIAGTVAYIWNMLNNKKSANNQETKPLSKTS